MNASLLIKIFSMASLLIHAGIIEPPILFSLSVHIMSNPIIIQDISSFVYAENRCLSHALHFCISTSHDLNQARIC